MFVCVTSRCDARHRSCLEDIKCKRVKRWGHRKHYWGTDITRVQRGFVVSTSEAVHSRVCAKFHHRNSFTSLDKFVYQLCWVASL